MTTGSISQTAAPYYVTTPVNIGGSTKIGCSITANWNGTDATPGLSDAQRRREWHPYSKSQVLTYRDLVYVRRKSDGAVLSTYASAAFAGLGSYNNPATITDLELWGKLAEKIRGHNFNAAVYAAEGHESVKTILNGTYRISRALKSLSRGNIPEAILQLGCLPGPTLKESKGQVVSYFVPIRDWRKGEKFRRISKVGPLSQKYDMNAKNDLRLSVISDTWLDLQYGWKPLLQDIYEAGQALFKMSNIPQFHDFTTSIRRKGTMQPFSGGGYLNSLIANDGFITFRQTENLTPWASLGLTNPASLVWEKLPFSFVADWFIPIGNYLDVKALVGNLTGTAAISRCTVREWEFDMRTLFVGSPYTTGNVGGGGREYFRSYSYSRPALTSVSSLGGIGGRLPPPAFKPWVKSLTALHVTNAIALIGSITSSGPRTYRR